MKNKESSGNLSTNSDLSLPSYYHTLNPLYIFSHKNPSHHNSCKGFDNVYKDILMRRIFAYFCLIAACAAASLAIGTRNGEQDTY